ncbi:hypothetical protein [Actinoplanes sp. NPDC026619]|uniref:hypothetical protein n=1 Tax=Actinoplanes sp. NPDC026619 TaxID=3155798 RepID=UPI0034083B57
MFVVERIQSDSVAHSTRWCAGAASGYCVAIGLLFSDAGPGWRGFGWFLAGAFLVITLIPQLFRHSRAFVMACWISIALITLGGFVVFFFGGCLFMPATLPLILAALRPADRRFWWRADVRDDGATP